jgi:muramidase (phage lysozyme)
MDGTLRDAGMTFDPNMPRTQRLLAMARIPGVQQLLSVIKDYEASGLRPDTPDGDYNIGNGGRRPTYNGKPITQCTIAEIQALQRQGWGGASTAIGAYQVMPNTLAASIQRLGLNVNTTIFNRETQDLIAMDLLEQRGLSSFMSGRESYSSFMNDIALEWASLPKDTSGRAAYPGVANNPSTVGQNVVTDVTGALNSIPHPR